ncbi:MAG TPA: hypothetical protein VF532_08360 [Candidatus Angelobacter sp.]
MTDSSPIADRRPARRPDCPPEDTLRDLAAGLTPPDQAAPLIQHAAQCDHCGRILRMYAEDFSDDLTPEDQAVLSKLKSASPKWQKKLVRDLLGSQSVAAADTPSRSIFKLPWFRWLLVPATAAVVVAAVALFISQQQRENSLSTGPSPTASTNVDTQRQVEKLLAQAYTEQRTIEMRIPYASHSDFNQTRSGEPGSLLSSPESLRKAADEIASQLKRNPDDPQWMMIRAKLDLADWRYKSAFSTLDKIDDAKVLESPEFLLTRSLALYEKAEAEHNGAQLYGQAVDLLTKVLERNPDDPVALFNRALACEKIPAVDCASTDWEHLIKVEKDPSWKAEIAQHIEHIQQKKKLGP